MEEVTNQEEVMNNFTVNKWNNKEFHKDGYHYLYHIHFPNDTDTERGYIGVTCNPAQRWNAHLTKVLKKKEYYRSYKTRMFKRLGRLPTAEEEAKYFDFKHPLYNSLVNNFMSFTLLKRSLCPVEIASLEKALRPEKNIGLNKGAGGVYKFAKPSNDLVEEYKDYFSKQKELYLIEYDITTDIIGEPIYPF